MHRLKRRAQEQPNEPPHQVIAGELTNEHKEEVLANLPEHQHLRRSIDRAKSSRRSANPTHLNSFDILPPNTETIRNQMFLHFDSGREEVSRLIILTTKRNLEILCQNRIFSNGTFKTAPHMFTQLFAEHGLFKDHLFPLVYAFTNRKDEETYNRLYLELKSLSAQYGFTLRPEKAMCDLELGNTNATRTQFPGVQIKGCLFHLSRDIWRQVLENGLKVAFTNGKDVRAEIKHLLGLPFVPLEDITEVFEEMSQDDLSAEVAAVYEMIDVTYVSGRPARGRRRALPPRFPSEIWNVQ